AAPAPQAEMATDSAAARARSLARREFRPEARGTVGTPAVAAPGSAAVSPAPGGARADNIARPRPEPVESKAEGERPRELAAKIAAYKAASDERDAWQKGSASRRRRQLERRPAGVREPRARRRLPGGPPQGRHTAALEGGSSGEPESVPGRSRAPLRRFPRRVAAPAAAPGPRYWTVIVPCM